MTGDELKQRSRRFALEVIQFCLELHPGVLTRLVQPQLLRAATGVATNYRAACRARSSREFASRLGVVVEEADESELWLDYLIELKHGPTESARRLHDESIELRAIFSRSRATTLERLRQR